MHSPKLNMKSNKLQRVSVSDEEKLPFFKFKPLYVHVPWCIPTFISNKKTRVHSFHCFHSYKKTHREISTTKNPRAHGETYSINRTTFHTHTHARNRGRPRFETWDLEDVPEVGVLGGKMTIRGEEVYNDEVVGCLVVWRVVSNSLSSGWH